MAPLATRAYWVESPGHGALRTETLPDRPPEGWSLVSAEFSGVSPGTERLVGLGRVPAESQSLMACQYMAGDFTLPIKYGYTLVGTAVAGALAGRRVFVMHPHQGVAAVEDTRATLLPDPVPATRAVLIPNLETALNAVWDADLSGDEPCVVVGGGVVGLLVAFVLARRHGPGCRLVEADAAQRDFAASLPFVAEVAAAPPAGAETVAFHASGTGAGLQAAIDSVGFEGRVVDLSWYGDRRVTLELGSSFHAGRKRILASQVGTVAPSHRGTHDARRRLAEVVALLDDDALDRLVGPPTPFAAMPALMESLYAGRAEHPVPLIAYQDEARSL